MKNWGLGHLGWGIEASEADALSLQTFDGLSWDFSAVGRRLDEGDRC